MTPQQVDLSQEPRRLQKSEWSDVSEHGGHRVWLPYIAGNGQQVVFAEASMGECHKS